RRRHAARGDARRDARARRRGQGPLARAVQRRRRRARAGGPAPRPRGGARRRAPAAPRPVVAAQNHYSLVNREDDPVVARAAELGIGYIPYFPLASGLLTGKYRRGQAPPEGA